MKPVDEENEVLVAVRLFIRSTFLISMAAMTLPAGSKTVGSAMSSVVGMIEAVNIEASDHGSSE